MTGVQQKAKGFTKSNNELDLGWNILKHEDESKELYWGIVFGNQIKNTTRITLSDEQYDLVRYLRDKQIKDVDEFLKLKDSISSEQYKNIRHFRTDDKIKLDKLLEIKESISEEQLKNIEYLRKNKITLEEFLNTKFVMCDEQIEKIQDLRDSKITLDDFLDIKLKPKEEINNAPQ